MDSVIEVISIIKGMQQWERAGYQEEYRATQRSIQGAHAGCITWSMHAMRQIIHGDYHEGGCMALWYDGMSLDSTANHMDKGMARMVQVHSVVRN